MVSASCQSTDVFKIFRSRFPSKFTNASEHGAQPLKLPYIELVSTPQAVRPVKRVDIVHFAVGNMVNDASIVLDDDASRASPYPCITSFCGFSQSSTSQINTGIEDY